jgi:hypothetical protein
VVKIANILDENWSKSPIFKLKSGQNGNILVEKRSKSPKKNDPSQK